MTKRNQIITSVLVAIGGALFIVLIIYAARHSDRYCDKYETEMRMVTTTDYNGNMTTQPQMVSYCTCWKKKKPKPHEKDRCL